MPLKLYDTYSKKKEIFKPIKDKKVTIYNCGPTVYDYATIGNLRTFVFYDLLRRSLEYLYPEYEITQVINITDVGHLTMTETQKKSVELINKNNEITDTEEGLDRMQKAAKREGLTVKEIAEKYTQAIFGENGDFKKLNIKKPHFLPKATDHIKEQIDLIKKLEEKGYAYKTKKAVYFDIQKFLRYEELIEQKFEEMRKGKKANTTDPDRKHSADFRLWQLDQPDHPMQWDSPWGKGFPGWHIECSAMSKEYLGQPFDIHTGGEDHIKVHHPNEIAQSEAAFDKKLAHYWLHASFLTVEGKRMGKSLGNAHTLSDIEKYKFKLKGVSVGTKGKLHLNSIALRYLFLTAHYRTKQDFTWKAFEGARIRLGKIIDKMFGRKDGYMNFLRNESEPIEKYINDFKHALEDDLNIPEALAILQKLTDSDENKGNKFLTILDFDKVLGLGLIPISKNNIRIKDEKNKEINIKKDPLWNEREIARKNEDWKKSDILRKKIIKKYGGRIEDSDEKGSNWYPTY